MPACRLLSCLALALLSACATSGPPATSAADAQAFQRAAQQNDMQRMRLERALCPCRARRRQRGAAQATTARLAALQLAPAGPCPCPRRGARVYEVRQDRAGLQLLLNIVLPAMGAAGSCLRAHGLAPWLVLVKDERGRPAPPGHAGAGNRQRRLRRQPAGRPVSAPAWSCACTTSIATSSNTACSTISSP